MHDYRKADLEPRERALCDFAVKLTRRAAEIDDKDIDGCMPTASPTSTSPTRSRRSPPSPTSHESPDGVGIEDEPEWA